jgi:PBP1b-binding outer membrane lipoprotein LpoB
MMIRLVVSCGWICAVTLVAVYLAGSSRLVAPAAVTSGRPAESLERKKTQPINVPMIANGRIEGYVVAQFVYLADAHGLKQLPVQPDVFVADEAFRTLYSTSVDFRHLDKYDLGALTKTLAAKVNQRLGGDIVKEVLVDQFIYVPKSDISR